MLPFYVFIVLRSVALLRLLLTTIFDLNLSFLRYLLLNIKIFNIWKVSFRKGTLNSVQYFVFGTGGLKIVLSPDSKKL